MQKMLQRTKKTITIDLSMSAQALLTQLNKIYSLILCVQTA